MFTPTFTHSCSLLYRAGPSSKTPSTHTDRHVHTRIHTPFTLLLPLVQDRAFIKDTARGHTHTHVHTHIHTHIHTHTHTRTHTYTHTYTHVDSQTYTHTYTHIHLVCTHSLTPFLHPLHSPSCAQDIALITWSLAVLRVRVSPSFMEEWLKVCCGFRSK